MFITQVIYNLTSSLKTTNIKDIAYILYLHIIVIIFLIKKSRHYVNMSSRLVISVFHV